MVAQNKDINKVVEIYHGVVKVAIKPLLAVTRANLYM